MAVIDPLVPREAEAAFWAWLDGVVARTQRPVAVLLTAPWHQRSAGIVAERYGADVWAHEAGRGLGRLSIPTRMGALPAGIEVFEPGGADEGQVAFFIRLHGTLVVAEFLTGEAGGLRVCPSPALRDREAFDQSLRRLLDLPIERVLVAHGEPVLADGRRLVADALAAAGIA